MARGKKFRKDGCIGQRRATQVRINALGQFVREKCLVLMPIYLTFEEILPYGIPLAHGQVVGVKVSIKREVVRC